MVLLLQYPRIMSAGPFHIRMPPLNVRQGWWSDVCFVFFLPLAALYLARLSPPPGEAPEANFTYLSDFYLCDGIGSYTKRLFAQ